MFHMNCPLCEKIIRSPMLVEMETTDCPHCKKRVNIEDIIVATKSFSIHRKDLLGRIPLYKKLLKEVEKELEAMKKDDAASERSKKSTQNFRALLKDLLSGARGNFRMSLPQNLYVEVSFGNQKRLARLNNLSVEGGGLAFVGRGAVPVLKSTVNIHLLLPGHEESLSIEGTIVWSSEKKVEEQQEKCESGLKFSNMDLETRNTLKSFIVDSMAQ